MEGLFSLHLLPEVDYARNAHPRRAAPVRNITGDYSKPHNDGRRRDHYVHAVYYGPGLHTISKQQIGTRYVLTAVRILVNPSDPKDLEQVHTLQVSIKVSQSSPGSLDLLSARHGTAVLRVCA